MPTPTEPNPLIQAIDWILAHITLPSGGSISWDVVNVTASSGPDNPYVAYTAVAFRYKGLTAQVAVDMLVVNKNMWARALIDLGRIFALPIRYEWPTIPVPIETFVPVGDPWPERGFDIYHPSRKPLPPDFAIPGTTWTEPRGTFVLDRAQGWFSNYYFWRKVA